VSRAADSGRVARLARTWSEPGGVWGFLTTVDHKRIAARYIMAAIALLALDGLMAIDMRLQLAFPALKRLEAQGFNEAFTLHGASMMFLVSVPVM